MGYYLTEDLVQGVALEVASVIDGLLEVGQVATVIVADLSYRADWDEDKKADNEAGASPQVLFEQTYGEGSVDLQVEKEKLAETGLLMMDREGVSLDVLFASLRQNIEEGDLYPSSDVAGCVAGHLAIAVAGFDKDGAVQVVEEFRERILAGIAHDLAQDDEDSDSYYVGEVGLEDSDSASPG